MKITETIFGSLLRLLREILKKLDGIIETQAIIMKNTEQLIAMLDAVDAKISKIGSETSNALDKIDQLKADLANADIPQSIIDKVIGIQAHLGTIDNLIPDAPAAETATTAAEGMAADVETADTAIGAANENV